MDTSEGFFFSFDAPSGAAAERDANAAALSPSVAPPTWPPPTASIALFPWVSLSDAALSQWASLYCCATPSLSVATKPRQLKLRVPKAAFSDSPSTLPTNAPDDVLSFTLCYQTSPEVGTLTAVTSIVNADATTTTTATEHRDVIPGRYYGGLKVWSCATLLAEYLSEHATHYSLLFRKSNVVAELGCGQGLPGLAALCLGARRVIFQDYNAEVLTLCTKPNLGATVAANRTVLSEVHCHRDAAALKVKLVYGDWVDLQWESEEAGGSPSSLATSDPSSAHCDVVLGADITFDKEACDKLACVLQRWLRPRTGEAILASKDYYFGTNGGYLEFTRSAELRGLRVTLLQRVDTADKMPHVIFRVTHGRCV
jgi:predicted nicotinamide N-methyase